MKKLLVRSERRLKTVRNFKLKVYKILKIIRAKKIVALAFLFGGS